MLEATAELDAPAVTTQRAAELGSNSTMFRLYAPTKALFDKTWKLPDVEEVT